MSIPKLRPCGIDYHVVMTWLWLSLTSALALASADAATKKYFSDTAAWETLVVRFVLSGLVMLPWVAAQVSLPTDPEFWLWVAVLLPFDIAGIYLYVRAITVAPLSHTLPYLAFTPVFSALTGWLLLDERVSAAGLGGVVLVSIGTYLLNTPSATGPRDWLAPLRFIVTEQGPRLMLAVALIFSLTSSMGKVALTYMPAVSFGPFYALLMALVLVVIVQLRHGRVFVIVHRRPVGSALVSGAMAIMVVTHFLAVEQIEVAYMIAAKRTSMLFGLLYGALLFREARLLGNLAACMVMVAGIVLLTLLG